MPCASSTYRLEARRHRDQVLALVGQLLVDDRLEERLPRRGALLALEDLIDVLLVDDQGARIPQALRQRLGALRGLGHQLDREVALEPVLRRDERLDEALLDALERHGVEVVRA